MSHYIIYYRGTQRFSSMIPQMSPKRNTKFKCGLFTQTLVSQVTVEVRFERARERQRERVRKREKRKQEDPLNKCFFITLSNKNKKMTCKQVPAGFSPRSGVTCRSGAPPSPRLPTPRPIPAPQTLDCNVSTGIRSPQTLDCNLLTGHQTCNQESHLRVTWGAFRFFNKFIIF